MARVIFVNGFNRSGTTLVTAAVTEATQGTTLTVAHLARHLPGVDRFLKAAGKRATAPDRGVDRLPVDGSMPEEYGWLLHAKTGEFGFRADAADILRALVSELADGRDDRVVVLKNPWDTGREQLLLDHVDGSRVLLVRRDLAAIEDSVSRAMERIATASGYTRALMMSDRRRAAEFMAQILNPEARQELIRETQGKIRQDAIRLAESVSKLPLDRVALLSYDELRDDPKAGAAWAAHLIDPDGFGRAVAALTFPEYNRATQGSEEIRAIDDRWARAWQRTRAAQVEAGILPPPRA